MKPIRTLVVDDSRVMRHLIGQVLSQERDIEVVGYAADAREGREAIKSLDPDVVTLDVEMPGMSGLDFLDKIMTLRPTPVVMVSSLIGGDVDTALQALASGAVDCIAKPQLGDREPFHGLARAVRKAAGTPLRPPVARAAATPSRPTSHERVPDGRIVVIGASAGGVDALAELLRGFPADCPPVVITQHMPALFTERLAARLDRVCAARVTEARDGAPLLPGTVQIAPGGECHLQIVGKGPWTSRLKPGPEVSGHRPSIDVLFRSAARMAGPKAIGVILTGMGRDGAAGLLEMRQSGALTIGQDEATSFVYGMPRVALEIGALDRQISLAEIGAALLTATDIHKARSPCP